MVAFLYTTDEISERECNTHTHTYIYICFKILSPKIKFLVINLIKEMKDLHTENYKTLIKETIDWGQEEKGTTEDEMVGWHH